ncbi:MAG: RnfABCDGE type electron transport complex subunit G [Bacteroidales bacterium]|nr:RnfABCDGE type electron transport complex subunit G [Bacteroidales bacterium]
MAKKESSFINMVITLFVITAVASLALGGVYNITKEPIRLAQIAKAEKAIKEVIPAFDELKSFKIMPENGKDSLIFNQGLKDGKMVGIAVETYSYEGYDPTQIKIMVGFLPDGKIINTAVVQQKETPGLGTKMASEKFKAQFRDKDPKQYTLKVVKDGGNVDAITAATISSRAFCDAVQRAYTTFEKAEGGNK